LSCRRFSNRKIRMN